MFFILLCLLCLVRLIKAGKYSRKDWTLTTDSNTKTGLRTRESTHKISLMHTCNQVLAKKGTSKTPSKIDFTKDFLLNFDIFKPT